MSSNTKVDLSLLKSYKTSFDSEKQGYMYNTYNTFSGGYISKCSDPYVIRMKQDLSYRYQFISEAYNKINTWWTNYNKDLESLENGLCNNQANGNGISEASVRSSVNSLPSLRNFNVDSYMSNFDKKIKGEELKNHYSQRATANKPLDIIYTLDENQKKYANKVVSSFEEIEKLNTETNNKKIESAQKFYDTPIGKIAVKWYNKKMEASKKEWDVISGAWAVVECTATDVGGYLSDGLTMFKAGGTIVLGTFVSAFRIMGGKITWNDVKKVNKSTVEDAMDEIDARREKADKKKEEYMNESIKRVEEYTAVDYYKKLPSTVVDIGYNFGKGVVGLGEKVRDSAEVTGDLIGSGIAYGVGKAQGIDDKYLKQMTTQAHEEVMADVADDACQTFMFDEVESTEAMQYVQENSAIGDTEREFVQSVGEVAGVVAVSAALTPGAVGGGATISPVAMGGVGFVTGQGEGLQNAYADGAGYYEGYAYGTVNGVIEGLSWYVGGKINMSFRTPNMGSGSMFNAVEKRILLDVSTAGLESAARTESVIIYKRKEDGSWYTPSEIWEMYDGSGNLEKNCWLAFVSSGGGEFIEYKQAVKVREIENAINAGDATKISKYLKSADNADLTNCFKNCQLSDVERIMKNADISDVAKFASMSDGVALKNVLKYSEGAQKYVFVNNLSPASFKEMLKELDGDALVELVKYTDNDNIKYVTNYSTAAQTIDVDGQKVMIDSPSNSNTGKFFDDLNLGKSDFGVDQNTLAPLTNRNIIKGEEFKLLANDPEFIDFWANDIKIACPKASYEDLIKIAKGFADRDTVGYFQVDRVKRFLLQKYNGDEAKVLAKLNKVFDMNYSDEFKRLKAKPEFSNLSDVEFEQILMDVNYPTGGCAYAAVCNSIFDEFKNKPQAFKETFGFDMYVMIDGEKHLNSSELLLDFYTFSNSFFVDDPKIRSFYKSYVPSNPNTKFLYKDGKLKINDIKSSGTVINNTNIVSPDNYYYNSEIINDYLKYKKSSVRITEEYLIGGNKNVLTSVEEIKKALQDNSDSRLVLSINSENAISPLSFYDSNGKVHVSTKNWKEGGGHDVFITDFLDDRVVVSSWGLKLDIPYEELVNGNFTIHKITFQDHSSELYFLGNTPDVNKGIRTAKLSSIDEKVSAGIELTAEEKILHSKLKGEFKIDEINLEYKIKNAEQQLIEIKKKLVVDNTPENMAKMAQIEKELNDYLDIKKDISKLEEMIKKRNVNGLKEMSDLDYKKALKLGIIDESSKPLDVPLFSENHANNIATSINNKAKKFESLVSSDLKKFETEDLYLINEDYRIKDTSHLSQKLVRDGMKTDNAKLKGMVSIEDIESASKKVKDSLRYTFISESGDYTDNVIDVVNKLKKQGYDVIKVGNNWGNGNKYQGINIGFEKELNGDKIKLEVQFHTADSFVAKEELTHSLYEVARNEFVPKEISNFANDIQRKIQRLVPMPKDCNLITEDTFK